jgi:hypothetical protein
MDADFRRVREPDEVTAMHPRNLLLLLLVIFVTVDASAISRDPNGVNVNSQGATTVFITFGGLRQQQPAEAFWCGELMPASPDLGQKCNPSTIFGRLPIRYDLSRSSGTNAFTDIMSIPQTVSRRAYEAAREGKRSSFFYVRRFVSTAGGPDEYVFVTCRLAGNGARVPFSLLDVQLQFAKGENVTSFSTKEAAPPFYADITYNGTGRLQGRWEIVLPGDPLPEAEDLLTEASVPVELRALQRRYTQLERFNVFLPPVGKVRLDGPDPSKLPKAADGLYQILLRIEASDDKEADSNLALAGAGQGIVHNGGVAGFPMPVLRYYVGAASESIETGATLPLQQLLPHAGAHVPQQTKLEFHWQPGVAGQFHRLEVFDAKQQLVLSAIVRADGGSYVAPSWFVERVTAPQILRWRVAALDAQGAVRGSSGYRLIHYGLNP